MKPPREAAAEERPKGTAPEADATGGGATTAGTPPAAGDNPAAGTAGGAPRILIVDDSLTVRMDLRQLFESANFKVALCATLAAAREELLQQPPALAILDVLLPDGDGVDLLREIKSHLAPGLPVMLLSTEAEVSDRVRGLKTGADDYVGKPYDAAYVLARARELIGPAAGLPKTGAPRFLLIDDSLTCRRQYQAMLEGAGYQVITAESGEEGLRAAMAFRPDAVIVDRVLPGGIDGDAVIRRLKQDVTLRNTPCLLLTGSAAEEGEELRMLDAGADAYLNKNVAPEVFLARMTALIRSGNPLPLIDAPVSSMLGAKKILAVDDSMTYLNQLSVELRQDGYDVVQALSGREALDLLQVQPVDGILLDVRMPGLSGHETCRMLKLRPETRGIPVLMLTAAEGSEALIEGINAGADDYISKSADFTVLKARLRAQLRRKQFEDENHMIREELLAKEVEAAKARSDREIAQARAAMVDELEKKNRELEAFTYAVSHDLRAPLRTIRGFTQALLEDFNEDLPPGAADHLARLRTAAARMSQLIDALIELSRTTRADLRRHPVNLTKLAYSVAAEIAEFSPGRHVDLRVEEGLTAPADPALMRVVFHNLLGNAWKFTAKTTEARVEIGARRSGDETVYFVRDNGAGFDGSAVAKIFQPFERLHPATEFPGAGIGLATVRRIIERHGGKIRAEGAVGQGAAFYFTVGPAERGARAGAASPDRELVTPHPASGPPQAGSQPPRVGRATETFGRGPAGAPARGVSELPGAEPREAGTESAAPRARQP